MYFFYFTWRFIMTIIPIFTFGLRNETEEYRQIFFVALIGPRSVAINVTDKSCSFVVEDCLALNCNLSLLFVLPNKRNALNSLRFTFFGNQQIMRQQFLLLRPFSIAAPQ